MKTFISAEDIEALADQGIREYIVDEDTVLTAVARETAAQRGIRLVPPGQRSAEVGRPAEGRERPPAAPTQTISGGKPRGCQHGPVGSGNASERSPRPAASGTSPVVDELIGAVKQMARVPGTR